MPIPLHLPDMTALLPSSSVAIKPPPVNDTAGVFLSSALASVQKGVQEYRDAKQFQSELDGFAGFYRSKGLTDVADLITMQRNNANPDIPGALNGVDTAKRRQSLLSGITALGEKELMFKQQEAMQKQSFENQKALQTASDKNITARQDITFGREKQLIGVKESLSSVGDEVKALDKQINDIAISTALSEEDKRTALTNLQAAKDASEKKRDGIIASLGGSPEGKQATSGPDGADGLPSEPNSAPPSADLLPKQGELPIDIMPSKGASNPLPASVEAKMKIADGNKNALVENTKAELASVGANIQASLKEGRINQEQYDALVSMGEQIKGNSLKGDVRAVKYGIDELQQQSKVYAGRPAREALVPKEIFIPGLKDQSGNSPIRFILKGDRVSVQVAGSNQAEDITIVPGQKVNLREAAINSLAGSLKGEALKEALKPYKDLLNKIPESTTVDDLKGLSASPAPAMGGLTEPKRGILDKILKGN